MPATVESFREYARVDVDDPVVDLCFEAAIEAARAAGVPPFEKNAQYDLLIYALALHYYDNRGFASIATRGVSSQDEWVTRRITSFLISLGIYAKIIQEEGKNGGT